MPFLDDLPAPVMVRADDEHGGPASGAELLAHAPGAGTHGYLCGPPPMLASVRAAWNREPNGLAALHVERFTAPPVLGGHPFTVELARSRLSVAVPADRSVLSVLDERVVGLAYSCRQGFCGTCRTRVLAGPVEHRDRALSEAERAEAMTICVSRAAGDHLVLDL
jgi:ferredoxin